MTFISIGGVEDARLEAKAKDTKKPEAKVKDSPSKDKPSRGQGQESLRPRTKKNEAKAKDSPFRGQTISRPRTGMLEVKAKNQGHKRKCSWKKKVFEFFFLAISKRGKQKRSSQIFLKASGVFLRDFKNEQIPISV